MTPVEFPQQTVILAKDQQQYQPLPAHVTVTGVITSCWEMSQAEVDELVRTRKLWISVLAFGAPPQPIRPSADIPEELG